jgi:HK97 family phage prohead protease
MLRQTLPSRVRELAPRVVEAVISTNRLARDGHIIEPAGVVLDGYLKNPVVLWQDMPDSPVGRADDVTTYADRIAARITFAPAGISPIADQTCALVKSGVVSAVSIGFDILEYEPLDPRQGRDGGLHITRWELLECSFVSVPADQGALVTARSLRRRYADDDLNYRRRQAEQRLLRAHADDAGFPRRQVAKRLAAESALRYRPRPLPIYSAAGGAAGHVARLRAAMEARAIAYCCEIIAGGDADLARRRAEAERRLGRRL